MKLGLNAVLTVMPDTIEIYDEQRERRHFSNQRSNKNENGRQHKKMNDNTD